MCLRVCVCVCVCVCVHLSCGYGSISASQVLAEAKSLCSAGFHGNPSASFASLSPPPLLWVYSFSKQEGQD